MYKRIVQKLRIFYIYLNETTHADNTQWAWYMIYRSFYIATQTKKTTYSATFVFSSYRSIGGCQTLLGHGAKPLFIQQLGVQKLASRQLGHPCLYFFKRDAGTFSRIFRFRSECFWDFQEGTASLKMYVCGFDALRNKELRGQPQWTKSENNFKK